jgi:hypothetical protein
MNVNKANNKDRMKKSKEINQLMESYSNNAIIRSLVNLIPYIGSSLDVLITSKIQELSWKRLQAYLEQLRVQFEKVDDSKIDWSYLNSEEFYDLFLQTSYSVIRTRSEDKIKLYSKILRNAVTREFKDPLGTEDLVSIIENLSQNDISFIKILSEFFMNPEIKKRHEYYWISANSINKILPQYTKEVIWIGMLQLERYNLIIRNASISSTHLDNYVYSETPILLSIIEYLNRE